MAEPWDEQLITHGEAVHAVRKAFMACLLYTSDAADERSSVDLGGRRIIKKKKKTEHREAWTSEN